MRLPIILVRCYVLNARALLTLSALRDLDFMEKHLNLWDLENLVRQYLGFNELLIKEYHARFGVYDDTNAMFLKTTMESIYLDITVLQWRKTKNSIYVYKYIYAFRHYIRSNGVALSLPLDIISLPRVLFEDNVYRASTLK